MKKSLILFVLLYITNLSAQTTIDWANPWAYPDTPGYKELFDGANEYSARNFDKAIKLYYKAAKKGHSYGSLFAGEMLLRGDGVPADTAKAINLFITSAGEGNACAMYDLGICFESGSGVIKNPKEAFNFFKMASDKGLPKAKWKLAICYISGLGTPKKVGEGIKLLEECANEGISESAATLGQLYQYHEDYKDYSKAIYWYKKAIDYSDPVACLHLSEMYAKGQGTDVNFPKAHQLLKEARQIVNSLHIPAASEKGINAELLHAEGYIYYLEGKEKEYLSIWEEFKSRYSEEIENFQQNPNEKYIHAMIERDMAKNTQQNKSQKNTTSQIISDIDTKIPENTITGTPTFAVIIANENYKEVEKVPFAVHDGETFKQYCEKTLGIPKNNIKYVADATLNNIRRELNWLGQVMDVYQGEANIIFYYAGHGIPNESNGSAFLLPVDGVGNDVNTGYSLDKLYADLSSKPAKSVMVLLDACFSGARRDGGMLASARGVAIKAKQNAPKGNMVVLSAAQGDETAYPYKEKGHGMFTYYFLKKLQDTKGNVSFGELADYVISEVKKQSIVVNGKMQTPLASPSTNATDWRNWKLR